MPIKMKLPTEKTVRDMLNKYACPVPYHEVRTRFLGGIASPIIEASPLPIVKGLWGGQFPLFDSIDDLNELIDVLVNGLWNGLTKHQERSAPFRLLKLKLQPSAPNLGKLAQVRKEELEGFVEGLFNGQDRVDLPETAHQAHGHLGELRAMMAGIEDLVARDIQAESRSQLATTFKHVSELTKIMELEIHAAVISCAKARRQMLVGENLTQSSFH